MQDYLEPWRVGDLVTAKRLQNIQESIPRLSAGRNIKLRRQGQQVIIDAAGGGRGGRGGGGQASLMQLIDGPDDDDLYRCVRVAGSGQKTVAAVSTAEEYKVWLVAFSEAEAGALPSAAADDPWNGKIIVAYPFGADSSVTGIIYTATPASVETGDVFNLVVTMANQADQTVTFTAAAATVANVTAGLVAAWNVAGTTIADDTTHVTITGNVLVEYSLVSNTSDGGGTNDQTLTVARLITDVIWWSWSLPSDVIGMIVDPT